MLHRYLPAFLLKLFQPGKSNSSCFAAEMRVHQWPWQSRNVSKLSWNPFWRREESVWAAQLRDNCAKYPGTSRGQLEVRVHTRPSRGRIRWANCHQGQDKTNGKGIQISMMDLLPLWRNETKFVLNISRPPSYTTFQYCHQKQNILFAAGFSFLNYIET